jgi:hypothetical protein
MTMSALALRRASEWLTPFLISGLLVMPIGCAETQPQPIEPTEEALEGLPPEASVPPTENPQSAHAQIDRLTAPIALYPDALLSQVLMATTYPDQLAQAAAWSKAHPELKGDDAIKQVSSQPWDPSVQSLVAFPQVLATLAQKPEWVKELGAAFLAQPDVVMDSVQRLRAMAEKHGSLASNEHQTVNDNGGVIYIEPTDPLVLYPPTYDPAYVYGAWPWPYYPPYYLPPIGFGIGIAAGIFFAAGIHCHNALWGGFNWGHHDVNINVNRFNNINSAHNRLRADQGSWRANNAARINQAERVHASTFMQQRQPGAYSGNARERANAATRAQGFQRSSQGAQRSTFGRSSPAPQRSHSSSGSFSRGSYGGSHGGGFHGGGGGFHGGGGGGGFRGGGGGRR